MQTLVLLLAVASSFVMHGKIDGAMKHIRYVGPWELMESNDPAKPGCSIGGTYGDGTMVIFGFMGTDRPPQIVVSNLTWNERQTGANGHEAKAHFSFVGSSFAKSLDAVTVQQEGAFMFAAQVDDTDFLYEFRSGVRMMVGYNQNNAVASVELRGSDPAVHALVDCQRALQKRRTSK